MGASMKVAAIIAEYNPFHNGHLYQIEETRRQAGADFIVIVMSGDFVQRGAPAFCDKYLRARMALSCGADIVIELPALYSLSSAEFFAGGAVALLKQLQVVHTLSFGSESGDLSAFTGCARLLLQNSSRIHSLLKARLKSGYSYPAAMEYAISEIISRSSSSPFGLENPPGEPAFSLSSAKIHELFSSPNNILALEYCKALYSDCNFPPKKSQKQDLEKDGQNRGNTIYPFTLKRQGGGYHDLSYGNNASFISASAIRNILASSSRHSVKGYIPDKAYNLLLKNNLLAPPITEDHFSHLLHYKLLSEQERGFANYLDCDKSLSDKICKNIPNFKNFTDFCGLLKSKDITYSRISRVLTHILLNMETPDFFRESLGQRSFFVPYARLLGFRKSAAPLLHAIKKSSAIPLLSKPADARYLLDKKAYSLLQQDFFCSSVYESIAAAYQKRPPINEMKRSPIVIS